MELQLCFEKCKVPMKQYQLPSGLGNTETYEDVSGFLENIANCTLLKCVCQKNNVDILQVTWNHGKTC